MDVFDVLKAISQRKVEFVQLGIDEKKAWKRAKFDISNEFHILLHDIERLYSSGI